MNIQKIIIWHASLFEIAAPLFYLISVSLRCFLETRILSTQDDFGYYTLLHHVLWYLTSILAVMLFLSVYLKLSPRKLLWLFYGGVIVFIPVIHAALSQEPMDLEYFTGSVKEVISFSLTAAWGFTRNRPQFFAIIVLDIGIFLTGYYYSRKWHKALMTVIGTHCILTIIGTKWFGKYDVPETVVLINTHLPGHVFMALIWLQSVTLLTLILLYREHSKFFSRKKILLSILKGITVWGIVSALLYLTGLFYSVFEVVTATCATLPIFIIGESSFKYRMFKENPWTMAVLLSILIFQILVTYPVLFIILLYPVPVARVQPF
ncbi:MAG: hypothetical protein KJ737_10280 [Proteobacteria bacterium]|nr:hypothetical protein [Pseudomonadota bacterium]